MIQLFVEMLTKLDDGHVTLIAPNEEAWNANRILRLRIDDELFDLDLIVRQYLEAETVLRTEAFTCGVLFRNTPNVNTSIGYIHIQHFQGDRPKVIDDILEGFQSSDVIGIIIDVRHNFGSDFRNGLFVASRFTDRKKLAFTSKAKNGPGPNDFASPVKWYIEPGGDKQFTNPVVILTDRYTISAAKRTVMALQELPHVQIIGGSTSWVARRENWQRTAKWLVFYLHAANCFRCIRRVLRRKGHPAKHFYYKYQKGRRNFRPHLEPGDFRDVAFVSRN